MLDERGTKPKPAGHETPSPNDGNPQPLQHQTAAGQRNDAALNGALWINSERVGARRPEIAEHNGYYQGRKVIHHDSRIAEGVSLGGTGGREAIVVTWTPRSNDQSLHDLYDDSVKRSTDGDGTFRKNRALQAVYDVVIERFANRSPEDVAAFIEQNGLAGDRKVSLQTFIRARMGTCRHLALACGAILERMVDEGKLGGRVSVDRNTMPGRGAHAWCRYTSSTGTVVILDVMQQFLGTLQEAQQKPGAWPYARPSDREHLMPPRLPDRG
jgi:hypothetical protein